MCENENLLGAESSCQGRIFVIRAGTDSAIYVKKQHEIQIVRNISRKVIDASGRRHHVPYLALEKKIHFLQLYI